MAPGLPDRFENIGPVPVNSDPRRTQLLPIVLSLGTGICLAAAEQQNAESQRRKDAKGALSVRGRGRPSAASLDEPREKAQPS